LHDYHVENYTAERHQIFVHVAHGRGSVLLWRLYDTLRTSGFVDDVMITHDYGASCVFLEHHGLGQYGAEPHYSALPFWQLCALKG